jgi:ABC-type hemin transport system substrate-binding protein
MRKNTMLGRGSAANADAGITNEPRRRAKIRIVCFMNGLLSCQTDELVARPILMSGSRAASDRRLLRVDQQLLLGQTPIGNSCCPVEGTARTL